MRELQIYLKGPPGELDTQTFSSLIGSTERVVGALGHHVYQDEIRTRVVVRPSREGSFELVLGIIAVVWGTTKVLETDIAKKFIYGHTDREPSEWAELVGKDLRSKGQALAGRSKADAIEELTTEMTVGILTADAEQIPNAYGLSKTLPEFRSAREEFYSSLGSGLIDPPYDGRCDANG